ncbi:MAG: hypothetical protein ACE3L7_00355 [Candidatus Pristimantibacillus sp.]
MDNETIYKNFPYAELKSIDGTASLKIYTYAYQYPDDNDGTDSDWYMNYIDLTCHGFTAKLNEPVLNGKVLENWYKETEAFFNSNQKRVQLYATEPNLSFSLELDENTKSILVKGDVHNAKPIIYRSYLQFEFFTDYDSMKLFNIGLKEILQAFPPRYK